ncbi:NUDIX hydrolase [Acinetobacter sp. ESL0695]|jgi:ADP-ribose pyrophosphatase YjhB (NUDIX family)|uniref:NUDIX hydrolase n=1 Tax=Acinetobacter pollinis TaxID=2605270 RepID=A0ABU6DQA0_9GAMM|nr:MULTISPECIES: NUDIX hydrolase [Acinetobacter]MEB5476040.1 NUDIX hydrolase [Acinetobacter pollinis]WEV48051.1 NUDIX hydrolase [Acinetobacter sp. ESL0695]
MAIDWTAHVTVATVIKESDRYLFVEEHSEGFVHTVYNQPAGHVECGETLIDAAIRETFEETGHTVEIDHLIGIYTYRPPMAPHKTFFRFCFAAHIVKTAIDPVLDKDIVNTTWFSLDELDESARARSPLVNQAIKDFEAGKKYPLSIIHEHPFTPLLTPNLDA